MNDTTPYKNTEYTLYLDMDGVLVDFNGGYKNLSNGMDLQQYAKNFNDEAAREKYLQAGSKFWADLEWIHGGKELYDAASLLFERVCILSSAGTTNEERGAIVTAGKLEWLKKNAPTIPTNRVFIVMGKHRKQEYAAKDSILVDDVAVTIKQWNDKGGYGILHNAKNYKKTIEDLEDISRPIKLSEIVKRFKR